MHIDTAAVEFASRLSPYTPDTVLCLPGRWRSNDVYCHLVTTFFEVESNISTRVLFSCSSQTISCVFDICFHILSAEKLVVTFRTL